MFPFSNNWRIDHHMVHYLNNRPFGFLCESLKSKITQNYLIMGSSTIRSYFLLSPSVNNSYNLECSISEMLAFVLSLIITLTDCEC